MGDFSKWVIFNFGRFFSLCEIFQNGRFFHYGRYFREIFHFGRFFSSQKIFQNGRFFHYGRFFTMGDFFSKLDKMRDFANL